MTTETPAAGLTARPAAGTNRRSLTWMDSALCAQVGPDLFFASDGGIGIGKQICGDCPVAAECSDYVDALESESVGRRYGVWAGRSGRSRAKAALGQGIPARDARIRRLAAAGWDAARIADSAGLEERTVYRVLARARETS